MKIDRFRTFRTGLLYSALTLISFKLVTPSLPDNFLSAIILFILPILTLYYFVGLVIRLFVKGLGRLIPLITGSLLAIMFFIITGFDYRISLLLLLSGVIAFVLFNKKILPWAAAGAVIFYCILAVPGKLRENERPKFLIVGLDSLTPSIVDSLAKRGDIPNLKRLMQDGTWGSLQSEKPLISPILWNIIGSGYNRDKLGIGGFFNISGQLQVPRIWDMFQQERWSVGVFRWPITWPPQNVNGFMVPDILARDESSCPPGYGDINALRDIVKSGSNNILLSLTRTGWKMCQAGMRGSTLLKIARQAVNQNFKLKDKKVAYRFGRCAELEIAADIFLNLMHRNHPQFAAFYDNSIDIIGHRMWKYHNPAGFSVSPAEIEKYGSHLCDMYRYSDEVLGRILAELGKDINIIVVSDHGMQKADRTESQITWVKTDILLEDLGLSDEVYSQSLNVFQFLYPVKSQNSGAFVKLVEDNFKRLKFANGERLFSLAQSEAMDYYIENHSQDGKDSQLLLDDKPVDLNRYIFKAFNLSGKHALMGTVIFRGENIKGGNIIENAAIYDITPTILHWAGLPVAEDMDGRILTNVFINANKIEYVNQYDLPENTMEAGTSDAILDETVKERLKALGYVK